MIPTCVDDYTQQVLSPNKVFNLLTVANMSEKHLRIYRGCAPPPPLECRGNHLPLMLEIISLTLAKKSFSYLEERSQKNKKVSKRDVSPP